MEDLKHFLHQDKISAKYVYACLRKPILKICRNFIGGPGRSVEVEVNTLDEWHLTLQHNTQTHHTIPHHTTQDNTIQHWRAYGDFREEPKMGPFHLNPQPYFDAPLGP